MPIENGPNKPRKDSPGVTSKNHASVSPNKRAEPNNDNNSACDLSKKVHWIQHATFWSQVGLGIIGIGALVIYYCQLQATNRSIKQAGIFFDQQNRSWVGMDSPVLISSVSNQPPGKIEYKTEIKNFGQSPAFNVIPDLELVIGARGTDIRTEVDRICNHLERDLIPIPLGVGEVLFPGASYAFPTEAYLQAGRKVDQELMRTDHPVYFFPGCIVYKDRGGTVHHTGICQWTDSAGMKEGTVLASCSRQYAD